MPENARESIKTYFNFDLKRFRFEFRSPGSLIIVRDVNFCRIDPLI